MDLPDPKWARNNKTGHFFRLGHLDPEAEGLEKASGVYVIWHAGVRPRWVYVGRSDDLAATFHQVADDDAIMAYDVRGGLYCTWSSVRLELQDGVVNYLSQTLKPKIENPDRARREAVPVPVLPPGL